MAERGTSDGSSSEVDAFSGLLGSCARARRRHWGCEPQQRATAALNENRRLSTAARGTGTAGASPYLEFCLLWLPRTSRGHDAPQHVLFKFKAIQLYISELFSPANIPYGLRHLSV